MITPRSTGRSDRLILCGPRLSARMLVRRGGQMKELGQVQRYLIEEFVEDWREGHMSRRDMVRRTAYVTGGVASAATVLVSMGCGPAATPTAAPTAAPTKPAAAPTTAPTTAP